MITKIQIKYGFTLIEILVAIGIIVVLSVVGFDSYRGVRNNMSLDLEADRLISLLQSMRGEARAAPKCVGMEFKINSTPTRIDQKYLNRVYGCDFSNIIKNAHQFNQEINISEILLDGNFNEKPVTVLFSPPNGDIYLQPNAFKILFTLSSKSSPEIKRIVVVNRDTGVIEKLLMTNN